MPAADDATRTVRHLELEVLAPELAVAQLPACASIPTWARGPADLVAVAATTEEVSIVAPESMVPPSAPHVGPWRALKVRGPLDFELTGILADLARVLADAGISIFAISTFNTDYILIRSHTLPLAISALRDAGHTVVEEP